MKLEQLRELGKLRQSKCYEGYNNIGDFYSGKYECDFVSPYTKGSCNVDSEIMVLLHDWTTKENIEKGLSDDTYVYGYTLNLPSNKSLAILLDETFNKKIQDVFTTNVFPYTKSGIMTDTIPEAILNKAFNEFCKPQIEIVNPRLVICCGKKVYKATISQLITNERASFNINDDFEWIDIKFFYQRSIGATQINTNGGIEQAKREWIIMKNRM